MQIDFDYLNQIINYFQQVHDTEPYQYIPVSKIRKLKNEAKFIEHVKYYLDNVRTKDLPDVHFSDDYQRLYIG